VYLNTAPSCEIRVCVQLSLRIYQPLALTVLMENVCGQSEYVHLYFWPDKSVRAGRTHIHSAVPLAVLAHKPWWLENIIDLTLIPGIETVEYRGEEGRGYKRPSIKLELDSKLLVLSFCPWKGKIYPNHRISTPWERKHVPKGSGNSDDEVTKFKMVIKFIQLLV